MKHRKPVVIRVGDLVKIAPWCLNKGAMGVVTRVQPYANTQDIFVHFLDRTHRSEERVQKNNLILVSEA